MQKWIDGETGKRSDVAHHYIYNNMKNTGLEILTGTLVRRVLFEYATSYVVTTQTLTSSLQRDARHRGRVCSKRNIPAQCLDGGAHRARDQTRCHFSRNFRFSGCT